MVGYRWIIDNLPKVPRDIVFEYCSPFKSLRDSVDGWKEVHSAWEGYWSISPDDIPDEVHLFVKYYAYRSRLMWAIRCPEIRY
jgi:hypothetical protein